MRRTRVLESQVLWGDSCRLSLAPISWGSPSQEQRGGSDSHTHRQMPAWQQSCTGNTHWVQTLRPGILVTAGH